MEQRRLLRDSLFNLSASVLTALLGLLAVPLFVSRLPTAEYADWIVMIATTKTTTIIDFGIGWTIVHIVAADGGRLREETRAQLRAAATIMSALAITVALATFAAGAIQFGDIDGYRWVILVSGAVMAAVSYFNNYNVGILWGLRRYDLAGTIVAAEAGLQSAGVVGILLIGGDIVAVAVWEATVVTAAGIVKMIAAARLCPEGAFRPVLSWPKTPGRLVRFSLASQVSDGLTPLFWNFGVLILGQIAGPAAVVVFHIGQKVPIALAGFVSRAAEVTMPAVSGLVKMASAAHATVAISSARIAVALSVPAVVTIWIIAEPFMALWVGDGADAMTAVMRIAATAVAAHSLGESARYFLWGSGRIVTIVTIQLVGAAILVLGAALLFMGGQFDAVYFSALQAVAIGVMSIALSTVTAGRTGLSGRVYAARVARGIPLATFAALAVGAGLATLWPAISWLGLGSVAGSVTVTFVALMVAFGLEPEETAAIRHLMRRS